MSERNDEDDVKQPARPNAWWARVREEQLEEREGDQFTGAFRGTRPAPHGGRATVHADDTLGADDLCWCGQPAGHSWPGKTAGARHPKMNGDTMPATETEGIDRRSLRAYDRTVQDFVLHCVNGLKIRHRESKNAIILYPPDDTQPISVYARNTPRQLRSLEKWYTQHVAPFTDKGDSEANGKVTDDALRQLAEAKNDPVEHPQTETKDQPKVEPLAYQDEPAKPEDYLPPVTSNDGWTPWLRSDGVTDDLIEVNGDRFRCRACDEAEIDYSTFGAKGIGGHKRIYHTDVSNLRSPEARGKATETRRRKVQQSSQIVQAIDLLVAASGYTPNPESERIEELETQLAAAVRRAEEAEAKLALIREATGL